MSHDMDAVRPGSIAAMVNGNADRGRADSRALPEGAPQKIAGFSNPRMSAIQKALLLQMHPRDTPGISGGRAPYFGIHQKNNSTTAHWRALRKTSDELYGIAPLPPHGPARWQYLSDTRHWEKKRRELHQVLITEATAKALRFAEAVRRNEGTEPAIYAMRGNTAVGKTRTAITAIPLLAQALKASEGVSINPDIFKGRLRENGKLSSAQVHAESCVLSDQLEDTLVPLKTADGAAASILVDKRLAGAREIERYAGMAQGSKRKLVLCDIDAALEKSLVGVLERDPDGAHPVPPYRAVCDGFSAIRNNRIAVIDTFLANPELGSYSLHGTAASGDKIRVAGVEHGELVVYDKDLFSELIAMQDNVSTRMEKKIIDEPSIDALTKELDAQRARHARDALAKYVGMSWMQALDTHSAKFD